jgi:hypothetical protein
MGTHGRTGLGRFLVGSVAEQVLRRAACPVLTVRVPFAVEPASQARFQEGETSRPSSSTANGDPAQVGTSSPCPPW